MAELKEISCTNFKASFINCNCIRTLKVTRCRSQREKGTLAKGTALSVMLPDACVCIRDAPKCPRIRLWPLRRDDSSCVLIGATGKWRSDWRRRDVGALIGQSACRLLALARETIDSTSAGASGSLKSGTTRSCLEL